MVAPDLPPDPDREVHVHLPEHDLRKLATARDPLAVVEAHRLNVCLRIAWLLGCRMCPECPRCNSGPWGCQDLFGSNMRPTGGVLGGVAAFELGTEFQQMGTPHGHGQAHVVCLYQFATLQDVAKAVEEGFKATRSMVLVDDMRSFQDWFHVERPLDAKEQVSYGKKAEEEFFEGFSAPSNDALCQIPAFLYEDAMRPAPDVTFGSTYANTGDWDTLRKEGQDFAKLYLRDAQFVFNRVQRHVHRRLKDGTYEPLNSCKPKGKKGSQVKKRIAKRKADFPKNNLLTEKTVLICPGMARRFKHLSLIHI